MFFEFVLSFLYVCFASFVESFCVLRVVEVVNGNALFAVFAYTGNDVVAFAGKGNVISSSGNFCSSVSAIYKVAVSDNGNNVIVAFEVSFAFVKLEGTQAQSTVARSATTRITARILPMFFFINNKSSKYI